MSLLSLYKYNDIGCSLTIKKMYCAQENTQAELPCVHKDTEFNLISVLCCSSIVLSKFAVVSVVVVTDLEE